MARILIHGFYGAMGQAVYQQLKETEHDIVGFDLKTTDDFVFTQLEDIEACDVIIDFSHFSLVDSLLDYARQNHNPIVICTTGLTEKTEENIIKTSKHIPLFQSGNMSLGINVLLELAKLGARSLPGFDIEIIEKHHKHKIDAPSGTAKMIYDAINEEKSLEANYGRHGLEKRKDDEIGIHAIRGGSITGEHSVIFAGLDEVIELKHQATSKAVFAKGAIEAALYLCNKSNGLHNMTDLILGGTNEL